MIAARALLLAVLALVPARASAQDAAADARALFERATEELARGDFATARDHLRESLALYPRPATAYNLGLALESTGETVAAEEVLASLVAGAYGELVEARRAEAEEALSRVRARIAHLVVTAHGAPHVELRVDGVLRATVDDHAATEIAVDAGRHVVLASAPGHTSDERTVTAERGGRHPLELAIETIVVTMPEPAPAPAPAPSRSVAEEPWLWITLGVLVAGGVAIAVVAATTDAFSPQPRTDPVLGRAEVLTISW